MPPITVIIATQDKAIGASCLRYIRQERGIRVAGKASSNVEAIAATFRHKPNILLLDLSFALKTNLIPALARISPRTKVLLLTSRISPNLILDALSNGAVGYIEKRALSKFLPKAIRSVEAGEAWVPRRMASKIVDRLTSSS